MKVAILLSGQPRFVEGQGYATIKSKILDQYDCDVFCHFWWNPEGGNYITAPWSTLGALPIPPTALDDIQRLYQPKKIQWNLPLDPRGITKIYPRTCHPSNSYNLPSMYKSMQKSYDLMLEHMAETGVTYDWVIRLRYDAILTRMPDLSTLDPTYLYAPDYSRFHSNVGNNGLIMSALQAHIIMNIYDQMDELYEGGAVFNDEHLLTALIRLHQIPTRHPPDFYIDLDRGK